MGILSLTLSFSLSHTHTYLHTQLISLTHSGDDVLTPGEGCAPSKQEGYLVVGLEVEEGMAHDSYFESWFTGNVEICLFFPPHSWEEQVCDRFTPKI